MSLGRLAVRTVVGGLFVGHGTQKLFGWFDGHGLEATTGMFGQLGLRPPKAHAIAAGVAETGGGAAIVLGAGTPLAGSVLTATMITAIRTVHGRNGPWITNQGYEYNIVLIAALAALAESGPGSPSVDEATGNEMRGPAWTAIMLALGAAGSTAARMISARFTEPAPQPTESEESQPTESAEPPPTAPGGSLPVPPGIDTLREGSPADGTASAGEAPSPSAE